MGKHWGTIRTNKGITPFTCGMHMTHSQVPVIRFKANCKFLWANSAVKWDQNSGINPRERYDSFEGTSSVWK